MAKEDVVSAAVQAIQQGELQVLTDQLGSVWDQGVASVPPVSGDVQAQIDAAVQAAVGPLNDQIVQLQAQDAADVQAAVDAKAQSDAALASLQGQLDSVSAAKLVDDQIIVGLQQSVSSIRALADQLAAIVLPPQP